MTLVVVASGGVFFPINFVVWVMIQLDSDAVFALQRHKIWCLTGPCECVVSIWLAVEL
jgi:hypothetical protein